MKLSPLLLCAAGMPLFACAQTEQAMPAAADPNVPVSPVQYCSVFADYIAANEPARSPDKAWVAANRAITGADGGSSEPQPAPAKHEHQGAHR